ncbi:choloylglycine hydrolase family protein [Enterovibrio sp. ZSDZ35]|uniref:Choloylglycine hydrolase family protein n=1 Tax=Enterovibrio qingdaonensis TaxID=2899818 RepID=A0ABT5QQ58_9GAMM|nr:choloylglycine hydrolase family protein [Enterovibrio sp. ZSDZ35]MDD1782729.1 choloylglycine hydrolase family protein [Enterovibrio sp. ZSDZ35]
MKKTLLALLLAANVMTPASACTGISLSTVSDQHVHARTIEWGENDLNSKLVVSPRDHTFTSTMPDQQKGLTWKSKYGFVGISVSVDTFIGEGVNEEGLTAGLFYFKGYGSLKAYNPKDRANSITDMDFVRWMLSQFKTVDEVKTAMTSIDIVPVYIDAKGQPSPTGHWRVTDKAGNNIVIEIMDNGKVHIYDNEVGVLTNSPTFPWQVTNLNNYINLHPGSSTPQKFGGVEAKSFGIGSGFLGLPGDITPPSRFVRAAFFVNTAPESKTSQEAVSQAFHIMNNFDIPIGTEFSEQYREHMPDLPSATQWTSVIDQANGVFYYKTMNDSQIKKVDLNKINFNNKEELTRPLDNGSFSVKEVNI